MQTVLNKKDLVRLKKCNDPFQLTGLLQRFGGYELKLPSVIKSYHDHLLFLCAFPFDEHIYNQSVAELNRIARTVKVFCDHPTSKIQNALAGSALPHTELFCSYSRPLAFWLSGNFPGKVELGSTESSTDTVRDIIHLLLPGVEFENISQGELGLFKRLKHISGLHNPAEQLEWLLQVFEESPLPNPVKDELYQQLKIFLCWKLGDGLYNRSFLAGPIKKIHYRKTFIKLTKTAGIVKQKIQKPLSLSFAKKENWTGIMKASLAFQYRETDPLTYADENELELFDMGKGLQIALQGMTKEKRLSLESYIGYMAFQNGIPVAYGGGWIWGQRCKIGINIYPAFRRGESAWLFSQVLRLYYQHLGVRHFIVKPYQFGKGNPEGLRSGAFWFYFKLGFRPALESIKKEAAIEWRKIRENKRYRTNLNTLRHFTSCNMNWIFGADPRPGFDAGKISAAISGMINRDFESSRPRAIKYLLRRMKKNLPPGLVKTTLSYQQKVLENWALLTGLIVDLPAWNKTQKKKLAQLIQLKLTGKEKDYVRSLQLHDRLWKSLERFKAVRSSQLAVRSSQFAVRS